MPGLNNGNSKNLPASNVIKNCFFLWSNGLILALTGIPIISFLISKLNHAPVWFVPKVYELKMYALAFLFCAGLSTLTLYFPTFFRKNYQKYQTYLLFFYPLCIFLYSFIPNELLRYLTVFVLTIIGFGIFLVEVRDKKTANVTFFNIHYNTLFLISLAASVSLIMFYSHDLIFTLRTSLLWIVSLFIFIVIFLKWANLNSKYFVWILPFFLFAATFWSMGGEDLTHYSFFLGPVTESLYGHFHPLVLNAQYGVGLTTFLVFYFKLIGMVSLNNMQFLLKILTLIQFLLIYAIGVAIYRSKKVAFLILLTTLFFSFYSVNGWQYYMAPSIGFLRFGFIYLILFCYTLEDKYISQKTTNVLTSILLSLAVIWSFESAIYTVPAIFFAEFINKNLKKFLPIFSGCFLVILTLYLSPFILEKTWPPISRYAEYALVYAQGFGQISVGTATSFWWLFPLLYGFVLIKIITGEISNKIIVALTIYGMAVFTYFGGRAHPSALLEVAIPFVLLTAYLSLNLKINSTFRKHSVFAMTLIVFFMVNNVLFEGVALKVIWERNIPFTKQSILAFMGLPNQVVAFESPREMECSASFDSLTKYIENNSIAMVSVDENLLLHYSACTKTYNALLADPYEEVAINPAAIERTRERAPNLPNRYILVDAKLLDTKNPYTIFDKSIDMSIATSRILEKLQLTKIDELKFGKTTLVVFSRKNRV